MIDLTKPLQTRDGNPVELLATNARGRFPLIGYIGACEGRYTWLENGRYTELDEESEHDLMNVPQVKHMYVNVYPTTCYGYPTKTEATGVAHHPSRVACVRLEYTEGQNDD
jgi:hypothetical protein